ncbi:MAG: insulinase family protein [Steroidobacteraceae bacterium]|jgi:predicted Zn-dependent peptidase|nr:insulinase family protein [Steroidobacteraceae bacterium]
MHAVTARALAIVLSAAALAGCASTPPARSPAPPAATAASLDVPVEYYRLGNGLRVVLSRDASVPTVTVGMYYHIGFRTEPKGRTGFAHLFEHMMFQGSTNLGKMEFIRLVEGNGGIVNGSTRFDYTNYFQLIPAHTLETVLWAEADRMKGLAVTQENLANQQGVVKNEVKVNVLNRPFGGFPWLVMPQHANENWYNAHNFYGDLADLDAATLGDVQAFFDTYYAPNNAVLIVAGDFDEAATRGWIERYLGDIESRPQPARPDVSEPRQEAEKRHRYLDPLAPRPALAVAWHVPARGTPEHFAMGLIDQLLLQGQDSALWRRLVAERGHASSVSGGINLLGNMFTYDGPMLWMLSLIHDASTPSSEILSDIDAEIARLQESPVAQEDLDRALTKIRTGLYDVIGSSSRIGLTELLASFALFDDDPARINRIEEGFRKVTPELIQRVAREYLRTGNRTVLEVEPGLATAGAPR